MSGGETMEDMHSLEEKKMEHFRETMDRLTAASHVQAEYFDEHKKIEGYYEGVAEGKFFHCDRLLKQENMFGKIQLGFNPNRGRVFLYSNLKTSRYDTIASAYQKEMEDYQQKALLKGDNENRAYVSKRWENAAVLIEKKENKPWTQRSVKTYLGRANAEAAKKTMPFFSKEEEIEALSRSKKRQKEIRNEIREIRRQMSLEEGKTVEMESKIRSLRKEAVAGLATESLLETLIYRKNTSEKTFLRKINYAYDFQKQDIENYYREKRKELESQAINDNDTELPPEDEDH